MCIIDEYHSCLLSKVYLYCVIIPDFGRWLIDFCGGRLLKRTWCRSMLIRFHFDIGACKHPQVIAYMRHRTVNSLGSSRLVEYEEVISFPITILIDLCDTEEVICKWLGVDGLVG